MNAKSNDLSDDNRNGTVTIEGEHATLRFERRLAHSREAVWKAITDPKELAVWFNTKAIIDARNGGMIDFVNAPSGFHTTGRILVWDPPRAFEHEWHIASHPPELPKGEPDAVIRWELVREGDSNTILIVTFSRLTKPTALGFAPGMHAFLDRLAASLNQEALPNWMERYDAVKGSYPSWQR
ncbi:MAG TPA: SRPBCC family protein [Nitrososphaera sp.]|nr:SRPBCC family protein [Nitrososphaera sp.]